MARKRACEEGLDATLQHNGVLRSEDDKYAGERCAETILRLVMIKSDTPEHRMSVDRSLLRKHQTEIDCCAHGQLS